MCCTNITRLGPADGPRVKSGLKGSNHAGFLHDSGVTCATLFRHCGLPTHFTLYPSLPIVIQLVTNPLDQPPCSPLLHPAPFCPLGWSHTKSILLPIAPQNTTARPGNGLYMLSNTITRFWTLEIALVSDQKRKKLSPSARTKVLRISPQREFNEKGLNSRHLLS